MGKTNKERAQHITNWLCSDKSFGGDLTALLTNALNKAERRGRHKERKWWVELRQEEIHWVPVRHYYGRCSIEPKLPFDAEKVRALISELVSTTFDLGVNTYAKLTPKESAEHYVVLGRRQAALHSLYKELGIE